MLRELAVCREILSLTNLHIYLWSLERVPIEELRQKLDIQKIDMHQYDANRTLNRNSDHIHDSELPLVCLNSPYINIEVTKHVDV